MLTLGRTPETLRVLLIPDDPFTCDLIRDDEPTWPPGTVCQLQFTPRPGQPAISPWTATVAGDTLRFAVPAATVDAVLTEDPARVRLTFDGLVHSTGCVQVVGRG
ncbi:MAG: DUF7264 domain-containing protein [Phycicoccus sp.]